MKEVFEKILKDLEGDSWLTTNDDGETNEPSILVVSMDDARKIVESAAEVMEKYNQSETGFISRTECLKLIEDIKCNVEIPKNYGTLLDILSAIRKMPATDISRWIPCSKMLPSKVGWYLVSREDGIVDTSFWFEEQTWKEGHNSKILAWQPLPDSFEGN